MKVVIKKFLLSLFLLPVLLVSGCFGGKEIKVESVSLDKTTLVVESNETQTLTATITPSDATNKNLIWSSSDENIVKVNNGVLTFVNEGNAVIRVKSEDGEKTSECQVTYKIPQAEINSSKVKYDTLVEAISAANENDTINLMKDIVLDNTLLINKSITIDGKNKTISAGSNFKNNSTLITINENNPNVTLKNIVIDGNAKSRILYAKTGKTVIDHSTIKNGKIEGVNQYVAGLYFSSTAVGEIIDTKVENNVNANYKSDKYLEYSSDLWVGANAKVKVSGNSNINNTFVNANSYSKNNKGNLTIENGTLNNVYLEYESNYGGELRFVGGKINNLIVADRSGNKNTITNPQTGYKYVAGEERVTL